MLARVWLLFAFGVGGVAACSGVNDEFGPLPPRAGRGGASGAAGSSSAKGGSSGLASAGKGGSQPAAGNAGSGGSGGLAAGGDGSATIAIDDAPATVAQDLCSKIYDCCSADEIMNLEGIGTSQSSCEFAVAVVIGLRVTTVKPAIDAGRISYDGAALSRCLDDYGGQSCGMLRSIETFQCDGLLVPEQSVGDPCGVSDECSMGYCDGGTSADAPDGTCAALKPNGENCADDTECAGGACDANGTCTDAPALALCGG